MSESIPAGNVMKPVTVLLASVALFLMVAVAAHGRPFRIAKTPDKGRTFGCATCHISAQGGGMRNPFGQDFRDQKGHTMCTKNVPEAMVIFFAQRKTGKKRRYQVQSILICIPSIFLNNTS